MRLSIFCILIAIFSLQTQAQVQGQDQVVRNKILQKLDEFKEKSLALTQASLSFEQATNYQRDLYNMFLTSDVLIEAGIKQGNDIKAAHRVYRADELGAWLRSLSRTQAGNLQSIDFQQIEIYWLSGIEKVNSQKYRLHAWVLPWDKIAYREGDFRTMPGVREVARELSKERLQAIMASGKEIYIGYLKMAILDRPVATNPNFRSANLPNQTIHTVQPGETLFSIAVKHGVEIGDIMADNNLGNTTIYSGQNLVIGRNQYTAAGQTASRLPGFLNQNGSAPPANASQRSQQPDKPIAFRPIYYTLRRGETARSIANEFGLQYEQVLEWNPFLEFREGDKVIVDMLAVE